MHILLTGGSGDVGTLLSDSLLGLGHRVTSIDLSLPRIAGVDFVQGSITDRAVLARAMQGVDCVVHIAAWHGVHEGSKSPADFHDLNVTGTFNTLQAAVDANVRKFVFVSSTSVDEIDGIYGPTKVLGEQMVETYARRHPQIDFCTLRPRAFIPPWNRTVYNNFIEWAAWFMKGAVHIDDFRDALLLAIAQKPHRPAAVYVIDGAYDYTAADLQDWQGQATFARVYPEFADLAARHGLDTARKPKVLDIAPDQRLPGYAPKYSLKRLLEDLRDHGTAGPPAPFAAKA